MLPSSIIKLISVFSERGVSFNFLLFDDTIILFKKKHQVAKSMIHFMQVKLQLTYSNTLRL